MLKVPTPRSPSSPRSTSSSRSTSPSTYSTSSTTSSRLEELALPLLGDLKRTEVAATPESYQEVLPGIYLGDRNATRHIEMLNIQCVIDISGIPREEKYKPAPIVKVIPDVPDNYRAPIGQYFEEVAQLIQHQQSLQQNVLVHCYAGERRSACLMVAYLMYDRKWPVDEAIEFLRAIRPVIEIPPNFYNELVQWQEELESKAQCAGPS